MKLVGTDENVVYNNTKELLENKAEYLKMSEASNPYDGRKTSIRIVDAIIKI